MKSIGLSQSMIIVYVLLLCIYGESLLSNEVLFKFGEAWNEIWNCWNVHARWIEILTRWEIQRHYWHVVSWKYPFQTFDFCIFRNYHHREFHFKPNLFRWHNIRLQIHDKIMMAHTPLSSEFYVTDNYFFLRNV